jgi:hypothetical protein
MQKRKFNQIKYKSEILSLIENKYEEISGLLSTYKAIKSENGSIARLGRAVLNRTDAASALKGRE